MDVGKRRARGYDRVESKKEAPDTEAHGSLSIISYLDARENGDTVFGEREHCGSFES
jgi:hypothetical protein